MRGQELVHEEDFNDRLQAMLKDPEGKDSLAFLHKIMRFVTLVGKRVPFGPVERSSAMTTIIGLARTFGAPSLYLTVAPNDVLNPTMLRLCFRVTNNASWPATDTMPDGRSFNEVLGAEGKVLLEFQVPISMENNDMYNLASKNPVATTEVRPAFPGPVSRFVVKC